MCYKKIDGLSTELLTAAIGCLKGGVASIDKIPSRKAVSYDYYRSEYVMSKISTHNQALIISVYCIKLRIILAAEFLAFMTAFRHKKELS
jgi:hypothetical protein